MFFERLSEENDKVSKSLLGTVPDGVKKEIHDGVKSKIHDGPVET